MNFEPLRTGVRWMKFNLVGAIGIAVQMATLWLLTTAEVGYMWATALAVELTVLHNFVWHEHFTWADRGRSEGWDMANRLLRFNLTTGAVSIGGNLLLMRLLVGEAHLRPVVANLISIAGCSLVNFLVSDRWVFQGPLWPVPEVGAKKS
jgi:putative flippase GtrA